MGARVRAVVVIVVVLVVGAFIGSAASQWWEPAAARPGGASGASTEGGGEAPVAPAERVRVEVLNGGGRAGMARAATDLLRDGGFDVVYYGNAGSFDHDSSAVLDRVGRPDLADAVARALDIPAVRSEPDSNLYLDVTVVLGAAWDPARVARERSREPAPAWWDLRRFFGEDGADGGGTSPGGPGGRMADPGEKGNG